MFCTLKEAAKTLNASEGQIKALLEKGILHEFREGPHRLVRESDVGALTLRRRRRSQGPRPAQTQPPTKRPSPPAGGRPKGSRPAEVKLPHSPAVPQTPQLQRAQGKERKTEDRGRRPALSCVLQDPPAAIRPWSAEVRNLSLRQWFWTGLVQDRPAAIALLSGLILLTLSALVAGLCLFAESL
jgi:hypothetical protein